ncbi:MAG: T9SS type A sorting domain-containing protein [Ferruginibacter sp.]
MRKNLLLLLLPFISCTVYAQSGIPDLLFGKEGMIKANLGSPYRYRSAASHILTGPDGKVYIILHEQFTGAIVGRLLPDGSIDSAYGYHGFSRSVSFSEVNAAFQPDGKLVIAGYEPSAQPPQGMLRLNTDGTRDHSFGINGVKPVAFIPRGIAVQPDGKILLTGGPEGEGFLTARYNADGSTDYSFNGTGSVKTVFIYKEPPGRDGEDSVEITSGISQSVAVLADGRIITAGSAITNGFSGSQYALACYNADGTTDNTFDADGKQTIEAYGYNCKVKIQQDQKVILTGYTYASSGYGFAVARLNTDGSPDNFFGTAGIQVIDANSDVQLGNDLVLQADGKIVIGGYTLSDAGQNDFAVARLNTDGTPDNSFDADGFLTTDINASDDYAGAVTLSGDGKILIAGYSLKDGGSVYAVAKFNDDGTPDNSFGIGGKQTDKNKEGNTVFNTIAVQPDGKIITAGQAWNGHDLDFVIARYNADGSPDTEFNGTGSALRDLGGNENAAAIVLQPDGKIIVAGNDDSHIKMVRYNADGTPDNIFGVNAVASTSFGMAEVCSAVSLQADGKIVIAGLMVDGNYFFNFLIARFNNDGTPDNTFGDNGKQVTDFMAESNTASALTFQPDGKIIVTGRCYLNGRNNFAIARYNTDGTLDNTFDGDGKQTTAFGTDECFAQTVSVQADGKILVGGFSQSNGGGYSSFLMARYTADGQLDNSFSDDGCQAVDFGGGSFNFGLSAVITEPGKVALGGTNNNFAVIQYKDNGTLDSTFGDNGIIIKEIGLTESRLQALAFADDRLYAAGYASFPAQMGIVTRYLYTHGGPLPVEVLNFNAQKQDKKVLLQWQVSNEEGITGFDIERSAGNNRFYFMSYVAANGNDFTASHYNLLDELPFTGMNFYRLKIRSKDGKFKYSKIITVNFNRENIQVTLSPNPAKDFLLIRGGESGNALVQVFDAMGRKTKEEKIVLMPNAAVPVDISQLPKGLYNLVLHSTSGNKTILFVKE